ncbi:NAD(P)H-binding protein [Myxococcus sp. K15C18031901]|uniref:NAD(P)H-binding protein n=1 Tax=Myxococcus dinghuensis TaxID=2906761 RepID=UPI0020A75DD2|nr:NAD(P)H-binding protein [Myxococcus dinghuensis]MCP3104501.1 NAD(P)H-binding protein [Myxococcus dinghuensis]
MSNSPILILGARGKTGRRVADRLERLGRSIRTASRTGKTRFDFTDPTTWASALAGVTTVYVVPMSGEQPAEPQAVQRFFKQAEESGARRMVLLSVRGPKGTPDPAQEPLERALQKSSMQWTILRPSWFAQNFSEGIFAEDIRSGQLAAPAGDGHEAFIDVEDIADVATAALIDERHAGKVYELSGPEGLSFETAVHKIATALGKPVQYLPVAPEKYVPMQIAAGLPAEVAEVVAQLFDAIREGAGSYVSDGVRQALGREPRSFDAFVKDAIVTGAWKA